MTGLYIALASLAGIGAIAGGIFFVVLGIVALVDFIDLFWPELKAERGGVSQQSPLITNPLHDAEARDGERGSEGRGFVHFGDVTK